MENTILLGSYPQSLVIDNDLIAKLNNRELKDNICEFEGNRYIKFNGDFFLFEPIEWLVVPENRILNTVKLISKKVIDFHSFFRNKAEDEEFDLIRHLNITFRNLAFAKEEQAKLRYMKRTGKIWYDGTKTQPGFVDLPTLNTFENKDELYNTSFTDYAKSGACYSEYFLSESYLDLGLVVNLETHDRAYAAKSHYPHGIRPIIKVVKDYE